MGLPDRSGEGGVRSERSGRAGGRSPAILRDLAAFLRSHGRLEAGTGTASTAFALGIAFLCLLAVLAFHFPEYLTTPLLRQKYSVEVLRGVLFASLLASGGMALANVALGRQRNLNIAAFLLVLAAVALGGANVAVGDFPSDTPYLGIDWFILDLLGSALVFVVLEKCFPLYPGQPMFRQDWQTDLAYFGLNHLLVGLVLLTVNFLVHALFGWSTGTSLQRWVGSLPFVPQLLLCVLVADLAQYAVHRAYHRVPWLWRFHAVHHSIETLDWLAGSRLHVFEQVATRVAVLGALYIAGFGKTVLDAYIVVVGFHAVLNHSNLHLPWGPLRWVIVTPDFHHWHHASDRQALDRNYAAHFSFLDHLFGTAVPAQSGFPERYGVVGGGVPPGFLRQFVYPFTR